MSRRTLLIILGALAVAALLVFYYHFDPREVKFLPQCPFHYFTGLSCPGCGSQRALYCLTHLDIISAWKYNAFAMLMLPLLFVLLIASFFKEKHPKLYHKVYNRYLSIVILIITILWFICRNIFGW